MKVDETEWWQELYDFVNVGHRIPVITQASNTEVLIWPVSGF